MVFFHFRCGRLAFYIPFPKSYVRYRYVEAAIMTAYLDEPCGPCPSTRVPCNTTTVAPSPSTSQSATPSPSTSQSATPSTPATSSSDQTLIRTTNAHQIERNTEGSGDEVNYIWYRIYTKWVKIKKPNSPGQMHLAFVVTQKVGPSPSQIAIEVRIIFCVSLFCYYQFFSLLSN